MIRVYLNLDTRYHIEDAEMHERVINWSVATKEFCGNINE